MSLEQNRAVVRKFFDLFNAGEIEAMDQVYAENVVDHDPVPDLPGGLIGVKIVLNMFRTAFPDINIGIDLMAAQDDLVMTRQTGRGTHRGDFLGISATDKPVEIKAYDSYRIANGKIVEVWHLEDLRGIMMQVGAAPLPEPAGL